MHLRRGSLWWVSVCAVWVGCAGGVPEDSGALTEDPSKVEDPVPGGWLGETLDPGCGDPDGGTSDGGNSVLVSNTTLILNSVGVSYRTEPLDASVVHVLVPDGPGFNRINGATTDAGLVFNGVPSGQYYLRVSSTPYYVVTDSRHVEVGFNRLGRTDTVFTNEYLSPVQLSLAGLSPWAEYTSTLQLASQQVDLAAEVYLYEEPPAGQQFLVTDQAELQATSGAIPVFEAAKGDRIRVNQLSPQDGGLLPNGTPLTYNAVTRSVEVTPFSFTPNGITPLLVSGTMQPAPRSEFPIELRLSEFTRYATDVHPSATARYPGLSLYTAAHGLAEGWIGYSGSLLELTLPVGATFDFTRRLGYGNPYPSTWDVVGEARYSFRTLNPLPGDSSRTISVSGTIAVTDRLSNLVASPIVPTLSPPRELTIDGLSAYVSRQVGSTSPVVSWRPPLKGTPKSYRASIYRYDANLGGFIPFSRLYLPGSLTQARFPPEALTPGGIFYLRVTAVDAAGYEYEANPYTAAEHQPYSSADTISALFTTP